MRRVRDGLWAGVGLVALAYILMAFVKAFMPILVAAIVLFVVYTFIFKRPW